jgi:hypothetical protein
VSTPLAAPTATDNALADLVLVRMILPSKKPVGPLVVRRDLGKLLGTDLPTAAFNDLRTELAAAGFLSSGNRNTFTVTDAGRARALEFLGVAELPSRVNWSTVIAKYLFPRAAGLSADASAKLNDGDKLAALVLKRKYDLPADTGSTVSQALEAIVCKRLAFAHETTLNGLLTAVLSDLVGSERLTKETLTKQVPLFETGLTAVTADAARRKLVRDWLGGITRPLRSTPLPERPAPEPFDLAAFAATVRALAAKSPPDHRFHDNKVFISALWRATQDEPSFPRLGLPEFKHRLVDANAQNLLHLSRADLVSAMDPHLLAESETLYLNAAFHFVLVDGDHP